MQSDFLEHLNYRFPYLWSSKLLIACSGGLDSTVLVHLIHKTGLNFAIAHCNYHLRGVESNQDEAFVRSLGTALGIAVFVKSFSFEKAHSEHSPQLWAREQRYQWFGQLAQENHLDYILTAHHADDSIETFFINTMRGTGMAGLSGIPERNQNIIRPLLPFSRQQLKEYALSDKISWREDASNQQNKYQRNQIRNRIIPILKEINPNVLDAITKTQNHLRADENAFYFLLLEWEKRLFITKEEGIEISIKVLNNISSTMSLGYHLFKKYGFDSWGEVQKLLNSQTGSVISSKSYELLKNRETLLLRKKNTNKETEQYYEWDYTLEPLTHPIILSAQVVTEKQHLDKNQIYLDKEKLNPTLVLRKWKKGDYFCPLGMRGKQKKVSKFFKDIKLSAFEKEKQWLLCSGDDMIWVVGQRLDDRYKVTDTTKSIVRIKWEE